MSLPREILMDLFSTAVGAVQPARCLEFAIPDPVSGRTIVVGAGKAAAAMARALEMSFAGELTGVVVVPDEHEVGCEKISVLTAAHPLPDERSVAASREILRAVEGLSSFDQVICLLSGGGSSLLCLPAGDLTLSDKQAVSHELLLAGADISEINCVRKHLSEIKGGRLALRCAPAACLTLAISDVPEDDAALIASGPTTPDPTRSAEALGVLDKYGLRGHEHVRRWLCDPQSESPNHREAQFARCTTRIIARGEDALAAAEQSAGQQGFEVHNAGVAIGGDCRELATEHAGWVRRLVRDKTRPKVPQLLLSGGETTVTVTGKGKGGRNCEYLLALAAALDGHPGVAALACDTDGIDGASGAAGAVYEPGLAARWRKLGLEPRAALLENDAAGFFEALDALLITGPTLTNVNDFRAVLVQPSAWDAE